MPRRIQGPDGKVHEFPDDFSDAEVSAALDSVLPKAASQPSEHPHARTARAVTDTARGVWNAVSAIPGAIKQTVMDLPGTVAGMGEAQGRVGVQAKEAFDQGDYLTAARKGVNYLLPVVGPMMDASADQMMSGDVPIMESVGELGANAAMMAAGMRPRPKPGVTVKKPIMAGPTNPKEAAAVALAREKGVPLDLATATGSQPARNWQKTAGNTWAGHGTAVDMRRAQSAALERVGGELAEQAAPKATNPVAAGEGVRAVMENRIRDEHAKATKAYGRLRAYEEGATPDEVTTKRAPVATDPKALDRSFVLRWLADDLNEMPYQSSSRMRGQQAIDTMEEATSQEAGRRATYVPRVAGSPVQDTLNLAGVTGTKAELATRIESALKTGKIPPKLAKIADAYAEAWDGQQFDFDLVNDQTLVDAGIMRKGMRSPITMPDVSAPGAARFFPDESLPEAPRPIASELQKFAVDVSGAKQGPLRSVYEDLSAQNKSVAFQDGTGKAKALRALEKFMSGPDSQPLTVLDGVLGDLKSLSRGADMPELRTAGQGTAALAVKELDGLVRRRAAQAGPHVLKALEEGRAATSQKYAVADVMDMLSAEPGQVFRQLTQAKDVGLARLRAVEKIAPNELPNVGRALLEDMLQIATQEGGFGHGQKLWADWNKIGAETKARLFKKPGQIQALDDFFMLSKKIDENPNPSGTGTMPKLSFAELFAAVPAWAAAKMMLNPASVKALTTARIAYRSPSRAAQSLVAAQLSKAAQSAGVPLEAIPAFAGEPERSGPVRKAQ